MLDVSRSQPGSPAVTWLAGVGVARESWLGVWSMTLGLVFWYILMAGILWWGWEYIRSYMR